MSEPVTCLLPVIPVRSDASDRSEMVTQLLFGETCSIIEERKNWLKIKTTHDQYEGWIDHKQVGQFSTNLMQRQPSASLWKDQHGHYLRLGPGCFTPEHETTFQLLEQHHSLVSKEVQPANPLEFALQYLGTPYLWGGRSLYGIDCSGYTQLIASYNKHQLPRDAHQQAEIGETISFVEEAQTGDLAFFDNAEGKVIHVGFIVRDSKDLFILHASGHVRRDMLDHQGIYRLDNSTYTHSLRIIKRIH